MKERFAASPPGPALAQALAAADVDELDDEATLQFLAAVRRQSAWTEAMQLRGAARFAELRGEIVPSPVRGAERLVPIGGVGTPQVGSFTADELSPVLRMSRQSAYALIADALDLKYRLPGLLAGAGGGRGG